jgi:hypothetical protein
MLSDRQIARIKTILNSTASRIQHEIIYKVYSATTKGDKASGTSDTIQYTVDPNVTTAFTRDVSFRELQESAGKYLVGDVEFMLLRETPPDYDVRIVREGLTFKPVTIGEEVIRGLGLWPIMARKM